MNTEQIGPFPIGVVVSRFNESITRALTQGKTAVNCVIEVVNILARLR